MRLSIGIFLLGANVACSTSATFAPKTVHSVQSTRNKPMLVLLSIDGLMPKQVLVPHESSTIPNLSRMTTEGTFATGVRTVVPSLTYPAHTTLLTGVAPATHGIWSNIRFDPLGMNQEGWYWYADDIAVPNLWRLARDAGLIVANVCWPVSVNAPVDFNFPQFWRAALPDDSKLYRAISSPKLADELREVNPIPYGDDFSLAADDARARFAAHLVLQERPDFTTVYLGALDAVQHMTGTDSPSAREFLQHIDADVGLLRAALQQSAPENWILAVVSDHGFVDYHTEVELGSIFRDHDLLRLTPHGRVSSWDAYPWTAGGTGAIVLREPDDSAVRERVEALLDAMVLDPAYGILKVYSKHELAALGAFPNADFMLAMKPGFKLGREMLGPAIVRRSGGTHGYLADIDGMDAAFFITGKGVPRGVNLGRVDMRDIAPTLASLLSLKLTSAEGHQLWH